MSVRFPYCPEPPGWHVDWEGLNRELPWLGNLADCQQDPVHHAEGDVWIHTRMVCEAMAAMSEWRMQENEDRSLLFAAALFHDVAKPLCTRREEGRITSRGHSRRGEIMARRALWEMGAPIKLREQIASLVRYHQTPFFLIERPDSQRQAIEVSQTARCDYLGMLAKADALGRVCEDKAKLLENISLFLEYCREQNCLEGPRRFASDHSRFLFFRNEGRDPDYQAYDDTICEATLMSGLPGAGKDYWIQENLSGHPVISLDELRRELKIAPTENQGRVIGAARELARQHLRQHRSFVWNATNISRHLRAQCIDLFAAYNARVRIVYVEAAEEKLLRQNEQRPDPAPFAVIDKLLDRWEVPDLTEAHRVDWIIADE